MRIDSISKTDAGLMVRDMHHATVRDAVRAFTGTQAAALFESEHAAPYR